MKFHPKFNEFRVGDWVQVGIRSHFLYAGHIVGMGSDPSGEACFLVASWLDSEDVYTVHPENAYPLNHKFEG